MRGFLRRALRRMRHGEPVVVVSGLPRSGTSMCMKMLEAGGMPLVQDGLREADEDNPKGYFELERVKELDKSGDTAWLRDARGKAIKVISFLLKDLPDDHNYKILFMVRNIEEVLASQAKMLERRGEENKTSDERMADIYAGHIAQVRRLLRMSPHFEVMDIKYTDAMRDARGTAERIREFLGMPLDVDKMAGAVDETLYRNRR
jgi:hypothetical protein